MDRGSWAGARLWAAADRRNRWRAIVAAGLMAGLTAGLALAALAGARRTDTALDRIREQTNASDVVVFSSQVGVFEPDWAPLAARPEVKALAVWSLVFGQLDDDPDAILFTPTDDQWMQVIDRPLVVEGRPFDPAADDEILISETVAADEGIRLGDTFTFQPYTDANAEAGPDGEVEGPQIEIRVVGIVKTPVDALFVGDGLIIGSPGLLRLHPDIVRVENAFVQLEDPSGASAVEAHAAEDIAPGTPILDFGVTARRVTASTDVQRSALVLLAGAITLAGLVLAGQVIARSAASAGREADVLAAIGMRRTTVATAAVLTHLPAAVAAVLACIVTAVAVSGFLPLGIAGRLEPDPGMHVDATVLVPGVVALVLLVLGGAFLSAWLAAGRRSLEPTDTGRGISEWIRKHSPPAVGIGTSMAFGRGGARRDLPVRTALLGAVVGVLGVASALTLDAGLTSAFDQPERAGVAWEAQIVPGDDAAFTERGFRDDFVSAVEDLGAIDSVAQVDRAAIPVESASGVPSYALRAGFGSPAIGLTVLEGRGPQARGEVAMGPRTAHQLDVGIGDEVEIGEDGLTVTIVGTALFPTEVHSSFDQGIWLAPSDYDAANSFPPNDTERYLVATFTQGSTDRGLAELEAVARRFDGFSRPADLPPELVNLRDVRSLPRLLAAFLAVLAVAALLHLLLTTARARAHEFAILRALGFTKRSTRSVVNVQGTALFIAGLVVGIPLGAAAGRVGWRLVAERVPLQDTAPFAIVTLALLVPPALAVARVVAVLPGRRVTRPRPAEVLRTE